MEALLKEIESHEENFCKVSNERKSLWEIDDVYLCSIAGTCLTMSEQRKILAKEKILYKHLRAFDIHSIMLSKAREENRISRRVNDLLNRKYRKEILEFSGCDEDKFLSIWDEKLKVGEVDGLYWVALSCRDYTVETLKRLFGDVHMLSHINGGEVGNSLQEVVRVRRENERLNRILKQEKEARRQMKKEIVVLEESFAEMEVKYNDITVENKKLAEELSSICHSRSIDELQTENAALKNRLNKGEVELKKYTRLVKSLKNEKKKMLSDLSNLEETNNNLKNELDNSIQQFFEIFQQCDESCPAFDLCAKRILIVGGITKLKSLYRDLVEEKGGVFDYHDGYMRGGKGVLAEKVRRSDVVLCPVDVNSHKACLSVKKVCKKLQRPYQMLSNSSLTGITRALVDIVEKPEGIRIVGRGS
jgi:hypothetical protein